MESDSDVVTEDVCEDGMQNLGGRLLLMLMTGGILVGELVVVVVAVIVEVAVGVISISKKKVFVSGGGELFRGGFRAGGR